MTACAAEPSPHSSDMAVPDVEYIVPPPGCEDSLDGGSPASQRLFKKHKVLPRPRNGSANCGVHATGDPRRSSSGSQSHHTLRHQRRRISGGELPPTPPAHSRTSSDSHSINCSNPSLLQTPAQSSENVRPRNKPCTPTNQTSPPTPEVTPPRAATRPKVLSLRPALYERIPSKVTSADSRTESFRTALESPLLSEEEDTRPAMRPSARTSQITVLQVNGGGTKSRPVMEADLRLEQSVVDESSDLTPRTNEFMSFDGEWGSSNDVEQEWDGNLMRNVTVRKDRHATRVRGKRHETADDVPVSPTNATKAVRSLPLQGRILTYSSEPPARGSTVPEATFTRTPSNGDSRRLSAMSCKSAASTIVEAILVEKPQRRNKTLRHVKRVDALRESIWQPSSSRSVPTISESGSRTRFVEQLRDTPRESIASNTTASSISSPKARREVWNNGGIPVVVVPDRQSSDRSGSRDHSLLSSSSRMSRRSQSISSVPSSQLPSNQELASCFERPVRRGRQNSDSNGSIPGDQRTIDYPPVVPRRTSSLSASTSCNGSRDTSRNASRAGSLTAESLRAHNESGISSSTSETASRAKKEVRKTGSEAGISIPAVTITSLPSQDQLKVNDTRAGTKDQQHGPADTLLGSPNLSVAGATPFSQASVETNGTSAAEISQAKAVSLIPHQNSSVLIVDHRPSDSSDSEHRSYGIERPDQPVITTTDVDGVRSQEPATLPDKQPLQTLSDMDSPLSNPRAPPEPPVLKFIPATPSGLTPAEEKNQMLGNFYEEMEGKPGRALAIVRRALSKRRHSYSHSPVYDSRPGLIARKFSLGRNVRKDTASENLDVDQNDHSRSDEQPRDESLLHPDWRPSYYSGYHDDDDGYCTEDEEEEETLRYPPIDNRPRPPKRNLSARMKRTFAIMPLQETYDVYTRDGAPEKRTIRRTSSGNLRVVKHRGSVGSLRKQKSPSDAAPEPRRLPLFPRSYVVVNGRIKRRNTDPEFQSSGGALRRTWSLTDSIGGIPRRLSEKRREKRNNELRQKISGPKDVRDGVGDIVRSEGFQQAFNQPRRAEDIAHF